MHFDFVSIVLGLIVILIFMAIFALLRTMNSPFIKRFEMIFKNSIETIPHIRNSHKICFNGGHKCELYEINYSQRQGEKTVYNDFLFLKVYCQSNLSIRFLDFMSEKPNEEYFDGPLGIINDRVPYVLSNLDLNTIYKDFKIVSNDQQKAIQFLNDHVVVEVLKLLKVRTGVYSYLMPLIIDSGKMVLDYRFSENLLNEIIANPRMIKKHVELLNSLASVLDRFA